MTTTLTAEQDTFYDEGRVSETGRFLIWLADNGPTSSKELVHFPGWGRSPKLPVIQWLVEHGYITRERAYSGKRGHPPIMHECTVKGRDWADILFPAMLGADVDLTLITVKHRKHYGTTEHDGLYTALCNSTIEGPTLEHSDTVERAMCANCRRRVHVLAREQADEGPLMTADDAVLALTNRVDSLEAMITTIIEGQFRLVPTS